MAAGLRPVSLLLTLAALAGCSSAGATQPQTRDPASDAPSERAPTSNAAAIAFAETGRPHVGPINLIALAPSEDGALTRDRGGGVRLWTALDGSAEPVVVPIDDPRAMSLARIDGSRWLLALLDASGGARIVESEAGALRPIASLSPLDPLLELHVWPGGEQLIAIGADHVVRLLDREGRELDRIDRPGLRVASLRLAPDAEGGPRALLVTAGELKPGDSLLTAELLPLAVAEGSFELVEPRQRVELDSVPDRNNLQLSPDGRTAVLLRRGRVGPGTWRVYAMQLDDGRQVAVDSAVPISAVPRMGLLAGGRVLVDQTTGLAHIVDLRSGDIELTGLRNTPTVDGLTAVFTNTQRLAGAGNWLLVEQLEEPGQLYLGYAPINMLSAGLSTTGSRVAWALADRLVVEDLGDETPGLAEVPGTRGVPCSFVDFLDDEHLLTLDWVGGLRVRRWRDGEITLAADTGNNTQSAEFLSHDQGGGLLLVHTNAWENPTLLTVREDRIDARTLVPGHNHLFGLYAPPQRPLSDWGAWTIEAGNRLRRFTVAELDAGLSTRTAAERGSDLKVAPEQFALIGDETHYALVSGATTPTVHALRDGDATTTEIDAVAPGFVARFAVSPDGSRIALLQQRDPAQALTIVDAETLTPRWARMVFSTTGLSWSDDGEALALAASDGGVVFDGDSGELLTSRCGLAFEARSTPPLITSFAQPISVCSL